MAGELTNARHGNTSETVALSASRGIPRPALAVEILSPSTTTIDRSTKLQFYARYGVSYYWIVDPDARALEAYELADGAYRLVTRAVGNTPDSVPPFPDLALVGDSLWP